MITRMNGIITEYDGMCGKVKADNKEYLFLKKDIQKDSLLNVGDNVSFVRETIQLIDGKEYIARFILKIK